MAGEEVACSGGLEVREAELRAEEAPAASEEPKEMVERVGGEAVSDPVVVVDGDSGDLSGEGANLEAKLDPAVLGEDGEAVESNAASGCDEAVHEDGVDGGREAGAVEDASMANGHVHLEELGCAVEEVNGGRVDAAVDDASVANGHVHPEAPDCVAGEVNGEQAASEIAGLVEQEVDGQELEGMDGRTSDGHDHTDTSTAESKVHMEDILTKQAITDATGLTEEEAIRGEQDGSDVSVDNGHTHVDTSDDCGEQEVDGQELEGMDSRTSNGNDHTETSIAESKVHIEDNFINQAAADATGLTGREAISGEQQSDVPVENGHAHVGMSDNCGEGVEKSGVLDDPSNGEEAAANSVKLVEQEVAGIVQDGLDGSVTNGHDHADTSTDDYVAAVVVEVQGSKSQGEDTATSEELVTAIVDHDRADISMANGHDQVERGSDSGEVETESEVCGSKEKTRECDTDATELVRQEAITGEQGAKNVSVVNGCDHPNTNADSDEAPAEILVSSKESGMVQSVVEGVESVHHERTLKTVDQQTQGDANVANKKVRGEEMLTNGYEHVKESERDTKVANKKVPGEEEILTNGYEHVKESEGDANVANKKVPGEEEILTNGYEHVEESTDTTSVLEPLVGNGQNDLIPVDRLENRTEDNREYVLQGTFTSGVDKAAMEADACAVEKNDDAAIDRTDTEEKNEKTNDKILQGHDLSKDKVECGVQGNELIKVDSDVSTSQPVESVLCSTLEIEKGGTKQHTSLREASLVSVQQQTAVSLQDTERELSATTGNHIAGNTELKQESDMEVFDGAKLRGAPAVFSALHGETRSDLADNDGAEVEISTPACDLGTPSGALTGDNDSKEISTAAVAQAEQDGPSLDDDNCPADGTPDEIRSENANAFTTSSCVAEMEYVQVTDIAATTVDITHKHNDDEENMNDNTDITGDHSESQLEINTDNADRGDFQFIKPHWVYLMKVPRFMSESHWAKIQDAQICLDELTQKRDAINVLRQKKKALCDEYREQLEAARQEERGARTAHGDKRNDLNSVQSMIGRMNRAKSVQEIDDMIAMKEKIIAHESISLKEEKRLLQDIKELKAQKKQLHSNMGSKAEIGEAFQHKEHIHEQHKILMKDSDVLLTNLKSLEDKTRSIKKAFDDERDALRKLAEEHQAAHEVRQKAYDEWFELKKEPGKKNKFFFMYRKDSSVAKEYVNNGDVTGLVLFCNNQVESFMELWNKDDDFRRQYVESNKNSTLRRLGTSDGRKLGPDEVPPEILPRFSNRMQSNPSILPVPSTHVSASASEAMPTKPSSQVTTTEDKTFPVLQGSQNSKPSKPKVTSKPKVAGSSSSKDTPGAPMPEREDVEKSEKEKMRRMEEELELSQQAAELAIRKEELRQEKAAAEKERLRLEQKAKAKEAEERKRRKAEKAQERAEFRARKEAELMEKKKAKKDKTKGSTSVDSVNGSGEGNAEAIVTNDTDSSTTENSRGGDFSQHTAPRRRPSRSSVVLKQLNKMEPMPLPLRNKGKRKMRQYIMVAVAAVVSVLALVVASKYVPSNFRASSS